MKATGFHLAEIVKRGDKLMKKGLSVLLVAAALFGFYGGAVSLNDVLACKDYWEVEGERSTADMNKLEDGLKQLQDNEEAYLDGLDQVADGEEELAKGEAEYAEGQKTLAQGEADYAAAPAKLAAGEKKLAAGEAAIAKGEDDLDSLNTLIGGIRQVLNGYPTFRNGYKQLRDGRIGAVKKPADVSQLTAVLSAYYTNAKDAAAGKALQDFQAAGVSFAKQDASSFTNAQYEGFRDYLEKTTTALNSADTFFDNTKSNLSSVAGSYNKVLASAKEAATGYKTVLGAGKAAQEAAAAYKADPTDMEKARAAQKAKETYEGAVQKYGDPASVAKKLNAALDACQKTASNAQAAGAVTLATKVFIASKSEALAQQVLDALKGAQEELTVGADGSNSDRVKPYLTYVGTIPEAVKQINSGISDVQNNTIAKSKGTAKQWLDGYETITGSSTMSSLRALTGGVAQIIGGVYGSGNKELINGMNRAAKAAGFDAKDFTPAAASKLAADLASSSMLENFYNDGNRIEKAFKSVLPSLNKKAANGRKQLAAGRKALAAGKAELAQGYADYAAAPGKLAEGRRQLAEGLKKLMDGRKALADGRAKLGEYEDGEGQVRDGLATLMSTEPNGGLVSILDRRNGDNDFDNGDTHLDLLEGLEAVIVGREYQGDSGVLITKEITARAIGTVAGLAAGVIALLAALLSLLGKHKAAGVLALVSAVAGGVGIAYGSSKGMEFSNIAGSDLGSTPLVAAGLLAAAAAVFAVVHLVAKKEEAAEASKKA